MIIFKRQRPTLVGKEIHQRFITVWQVKILLLNELEHGALGELVHTAGADKRCV